MDTRPDSARRADEIVWAGYVVIISFTYCDVLMNEIVTYYSSHKSKITRPVELERVLSAFKTGHFASEISKVRNVLKQQGELKYKEAKRMLPAIAFCGEFSGGHAKEDLVRYNNLLVFDVDHLTGDEMRKAYSTLSSDEHILAFWVSPSGNGYKGLIRVLYQNIPESIEFDLCYKKAFKEITTFFYNHFGIELDTNCSDYSRICYVCWDPNLYINDGATSFAVDCSHLSKEEKKVSRVSSSDQVMGATPSKIVNVSGKNSQHDRNIISAILKYLAKRNLSITSMYDDWLRVGFALANTFNYDLGVKYFLAFSKMDADKYDERKCIEKLQECYINGRGDVTLGTIVEMARSKGFKGSSEDM